MPFDECQSVASAKRLGKRGNSLTPPLGQDGQTAEKPKKNRKQGRRDLVADQRRAASIYWHFKGLAGPDEKLPGRGVTFCGWTQIAEQQSALMRVMDPEAGGHRAFFTGIQMCGLRWVCPCCTASAAQQDRAFVNDGLAAARGRGLWPVMVTLTTRHTKKERAEDVLAGIIRAEQKLKTVKAWRRFSDRCAGYARVLEWTHGKHGHHPHFHMIALVRARNENEAIGEAEKLQGAYMRQLAAAGRDGESADAWKHSFQVQGAAAAGGYVAKWGSAEELTGALAKAGNGEGLTPWQLLRLARTASDERDRQRYALTWWQIICATKGKAQLYKSEGWRQIVEEWRSEQEPEVEPEPEQVLAFGVRQRGGDPAGLWAIARNRRLSMCEAAEACSDLAAATAAAAEAAVRGRTDDEILAPPADDDDDMTLIE